MKRTLILGLGMLLVVAVTSASAQSRQAGPPSGQAVAGQSFVDADGDGICDNFQPGAKAGSGQGKGYGRGKGNGTHVGPQDGTGFGPGAGNGTGTCDGTGPKGKGRGPRR